MTSQDSYKRYKDASLPIEERVEDLLGLMTVEEKAGLLFQNMVSVGPGGKLQTERDERFHIEPTRALVKDKLMSHFNIRGSIADARETAEWHNRVQELALSTRLAIPVTISTDPRHHFTDNVGTSARAGVLSQWPESLGFAALQSAELVEQFADIARQEYLALGIRLALHPQVDLATEPRWARSGATFGEDATLSAELVAAYIRGFQGKGPGLGSESVSTMTKHFPGGGPQKDGEDSHFTYGKEQVYPGGKMEYHLIPFKAAIAAGAAQMMPYYSLTLGTEYEEVGFGFNRGIITGLLREKLGFSGIVCTDWGLVTDSVIAGQDMPARAWGVEHLSELERVKKILDAGCDQLGGESRPELVVQLVEQGLVSEDRLDVSVRRLLHEKFALGLFEQPFVDPDKAAAVVGKQSFRELGDSTQRRAFTLLTNQNDILPLDPATLCKVYIEGIDPAIITARGLEVTDKPLDADIALLRLKAPHQARPGGFENRFHSGSLEFSVEEKSRLAGIFQAVPTVVDIYLDRAAVIPEIASAAKALMADYGASADAFLDIVFGKARPEGRLPFDLPSSMKAVEKSRSDVPYDTAHPTFRFGHGLSY
ncbi:hypothetical protein ASPZODRAFT_65670 [Penicilliopsis zonata CBS 506.65]|uniref:beta-glucosidase n=1 Tax=Penicilliopsis zonata CBS 506.65 TaxID=1073090 RepID=A0A1L9SI77_9EURO|nr:hypothetical protein ASPZODRAFT_65670 [Penicilliopsis zonata CBS 506.65]OJJ46837.1 hypothetical protein ASPZODRAFT_65670 [Penicilliopsis zonata CBS 506.65]